MLPHSSIPYGLCQCGCGRRTTISPRSETRIGRVKGQPMRFISGHRPRLTPEAHAERFWRKVQRNEGCWTYSGATNRQGYGRVNVQDRATQAHRYAWVLTYGSIPNGLFVCHHCDNPPCVRPDHLFLGTPADNAGDMVRKGRCVVLPPWKRQNPTRWSRIAECCVVCGKTDNKHASKGKCFRCDTKERRQRKREKVNV